MKIDELKINSYGKLKDKEFKLEKGINIIYGENERGKSTLLNFIVNSFYGTSRNKKGRDMSDYDKYKPWDTEDFSGKISYTLDDGKKYEVYREFSKKNPKIYDENMNEISKEYSIDKSSGNQFFFEQTKVDEHTFVSSVASFQNEIELDDQTQNVLLQKMANTSSTGADNISYKKAMDKLYKKQLDEVGTSRSQGKPINIVANEIESITNKNNELKKYENYKYEIEDKRSSIVEDINKLNSKYNLLRDYNQIIGKEKIEKEKIKFTENKIDELEEKIEYLNDQEKKLKNSKSDSEIEQKEKFNRAPYVVLSIICAILTIVIYFFTKNIIISCAPIIGIIASLVAMFFKENKVKKINNNIERRKSKITIENENLDKKAYEIRAQLNLLEKTQKDQIDEVEKIKNEVMLKINQSKDLLKSKYEDKFSFYELNKIMELNNLESEIKNVQDLINEKNIELHRLDLDKENIMPKLEELAENEEFLDNRKEIYEELKEKNEAMILVKEILENAYQKMKNEVTPVFTQNLSKNISKVTNGKYNKVIINEEDGILVELQNGEYKSANRLSIGTIQQLYLAFRLSVVENLSDESMPIILDEPFAFYDDARLKETIKNINDLYAEKHQVILFTCTNRELQAMQQLGYTYNYVCL